MLFLLFFLHAGPWNHPGGFGDGGWGPPFGFFPFFPFFPGFFWLGLIFFVVTRVNRGRWRHHRGGMTPPPATSGPAATGPAWPDLDPNDPAPPTAPAPKQAHDSERGKVEYV